MNARYLEDNRIAPHSAHLLSWQPCPLWEPSPSHPIWLYTRGLAVFCVHVCLLYVWFVCILYVPSVLWYRLHILCWRGHKTLLNPIQSWSESCILVNTWTHGKLLRFEINFLVVIVVVVYWNIVAVLLHLFSDFFLQIALVECINGD